MKKLVTAATAAAFLFGVSAAMAEDTNHVADPTKETATQQQKKTESTNGVKTPAMTTGSGMSKSSNSSIQGGEPVPGKPGDTTKEIHNK